MNPKTKQHERNFTYEYLEPYAKLTHENCNFDLSKIQFATIREWIRENKFYEHDLQLPVFNSIQEACSWCKLVLKAKRKSSDMSKESFDFESMNLDSILK